MTVFQSVNQTFCNYYDLYCHIPFKILIISEVEDILVAPCCTWFPTVSCKVVKCKFQTQKVRMDNSLKE